MLSNINIANSMSVEQMYKSCLKYKNNSFEISSPSTHTCLAYMSGTMQTLDASCRAQKAAFGKGSFYLANTKDITVDQFIMSFLKYAEKEVSEWNVWVAGSLISWASKDFPCT